MSNDDKVKELNKRIGAALPHSNTLPHKKSVNPNVDAIKELAKNIRETVEDYPIETSIYPKPR